MGGEEDNEKSDMVGDLGKRTVFLYQAAEALRNVNSSVHNYVVQEGGAAASKIHLDLKSEGHCPDCHALWTADNVRVRVQNPLPYTSRLERQLKLYEGKQRRGERLNSREKWILKRSDRLAWTVLRKCLCCGTEDRRRVKKPPPDPAVDRQPTAEDVQPVAESSKKKKKKKKKQMESLTQNASPKAAKLDPATPPVSSRITSAVPARSELKAKAEKMLAKDTQSLVTNQRRTVPISSSNGLGAQEISKGAKKKNKKKKSGLLLAKLKEEEKHSKKSGNLLDLFLS